MIAKGTVIGEGCRIKSGSIIGEKGFGFVREGEAIHEFPLRKCDHRKPG